MFLVGSVVSTSLWAQAPDVTAGKAKFDMLCSPCHGAGGLGDGAAAAALNPKPRNLTLTIKTDDELKKTIKEGGAAVGLTATMPAWGAILSDADIANVVAFVRSLKK